MLSVDAYLLFVVVPFKAHNIFPRLKESGDVFACKGQAPLTACVQVLRWHDIKKKKMHDYKYEKCCQLLWARAHMRLQEAKWKSVLWSDGST